MFIVSLNKNFLLLASQKVQTPAAVNANILSILLCRQYSIQLLESQKHLQSQVTVSRHQTFQSWNKLKGFDESHK